MTDLIPTISAEDAASAHELIKDVLTAKDTTGQLDLSAGSALDQLLVENEAYLQAFHQAQFNDLDLSCSLQAIVDNLVDVSDERVDSIASNYFLERQGATNAEGPIKVVVDQPIPYQLPATFAFTSNGLTFVTNNAFRVYPPDSVGVVDSASARRMIERSDGLFEFTITVVASASGVASKLNAGTTVTMSNPLAGMLSAAVAADFTGGDEQESNEDLLARASAGVTAKVLAGPEHIQAAIAAQWPGTTVAVIGIGSDLMRRDRGNLFGISNGATQDLYCRTTAFPRTKTITINGTVLNGAARTVVLPITYADGVGLYRVIGVRATGLVALGGDKPTTVATSLYTGTVWLPKTPLPADAAYSANAITTVQFVDTTTTGALATGQAVTYDVDLQYMPTIEAINTFATDPLIRPAGQDLMVRAGIPCVVSVGATIRIPSGVASPDLDALKQSIADAVNALPFGTPSLSSFVIHRAVAAVVTRGDVVNTTMRATVLAPEGVDINLGTTVELTLPDRSDIGVGPANTFFTTAPEQIELTLVSR